MRAKTTEFLKILNRARPEQKAIEKKTITWVDKAVLMIMIVYYYDDDNETSHDDRNNNDSDLW